MGFLKRFASGVAEKVGGFFGFTALMSVDFAYTMINTFTPKYKPGTLVSQGLPGHGGLWPAYEPPNEGDSRCSCPALNALANHGILPHDGKKILFTDMEHKIHEVYNFAPTFCRMVPGLVAKTLGRDFKTGKFDLNDIDVHNFIEHDASLVRHDARQVPDQSVPAQDLITQLIGHATGNGGQLMTNADLARALGQRRVQSKETNGQYTQSFDHKMFGSSNSSTLLTIFGGIVPDIETFLREERLPENWESRILAKKGLTIGTFNKTVFNVEFSVSEDPKNHVVPAKQPVDESAKTK